MYVNTIYITFYTKVHRGNNTEASICCLFKFLHTCRIALDKHDSWRLTAGSSVLAFLFSGCLTKPALCSPGTIAPFLLKGFPFHFLSLSNDCLSHIFPPSLEIILQGFQPRVI